MAIITITVKKVMGIQPLLNSKKITINNYHLMSGRINVMFASTNANNSSNNSAGFYWR